MTTNPQSTTASDLLVPLVGAHFRPPAKQVLACLPAGCRLELEQEPGNPYDAKAVKVLVHLGSALPVSQFQALDSACAGTGHDVRELLASPEPMHLGYVEDSDGKAHAKRRAAGFTGGGNAQVLALADLVGWSGLRASLAFGLDGQPLVRVQAVAEAEIGDVP